MRKVIVNSFFAANALSALLALIVAFDIVNSDSFIFLIPDILEVILLLPFVYWTASFARIPYRSYLPLLIPFLIPGLLLDAAHNWVSIAYRAFMLGMVIYCGHQRRIYTRNRCGFLANKDFVSSKLVAGWKAVTLMTAIVAVNVITFAGIKGFRALKDEVGSTVVFKIDGIYTHVQTFEKEDRKAIVIGMLHLGDAKFYGKLFDWIPPTDSLVLLEGISDKKKMNAPDTTIATAAKVLKKSNQMAVTNPNLEILRESIYADVDVSEVSPLAQKYAIENKTTNSILAKTLMPDDERADLHKAKDQYMLERNQSLMKHFDKNDGKYTTIAFTWGAGHSEYIGNALTERGYTLVETREEKAFSFW